MRITSLLTKRALSAALFVLLLSVVGMKNALAQNQVATLQHNDTITGVFYGQNAYSSAYNAAVDGDVITLSSGTFAGILVSKSITIRGAGCVYDSLTHVLPTIITGNFSIRSSNVSFEGIWFTGDVNISDWYINHNIGFDKCNINTVQNSYAYSSDPRRFCQFSNCIVKNFASRYFHGTSIVNSVVKFTENVHEDIYNLTSIYNSVIVFADGKPVKNMIAYNSVIAIDSVSSVSNCTFFNTIAIQTGVSLLFEGQTAQNVMTADSYSDVFETFDGTLSYENIYQLKNAIAISFLGHDGTEVGIYGGLMPYKTRPSYMILKSINVAGQTNENQKLNVEMELLDPND
ncbi:MAG: hypothetical protein IJP44_03070 [Bacteroidales bacterium]|nr:hypothetical protein [Bacteroidales bacterium]